MIYLIFLLAFQSHLFPQFFKSCTRPKILHEERKQNILEKLQKEYSTKPSYNDLLVFYREIQTKLENNTDKKWRELVFDPSNFFAVITQLLEYGPNIYVLKYLKDKEVTVSNFEETIINIKKMLCDMIENETIKTPASWFLNDIFVTEIFFEIDFNEKTLVASGYWTNF